MKSALMNELKLYDWQLDNYTYLINLNKRLPGAILLTAANGLGAKHLIKYWSKALLCENLVDDMACNNCSSCILFNEESHPDLFTIKLAEESKSISIDEVRSAINFVSLSSHIAKRKIVVCEDLNILSTSAANALLKILEEPPQNSLFILLSDNLGKVLPTIRSRCHKYSLTMPTYEMIQNYLAHNEMVNSEFWLNYYGNCPLFEVEITENQLDLIINTLVTPSIDNIFNLTQEVDGKIVKFGFIIEFLSKWVSDLTSLKFSNSLCYFRPYRDRILPLLNRFDEKKVFYLNDKLSFLANWANHPLNYKLQIENLLFQYQQLFTK